MKKINIAVSAVLSLVSGVAAADGLKPRPHYGEIGRRIAVMLPRHHVLNQPFDDRISQIAWTNIVTYYDVDRSIFLKSDLEELAAHEFTVDDEIKAGDVSFGYKVHSLYSRRLAERIGFATNFIAKADWDFSVDEYYSMNRKEAEWPATREEAEEIWRKRLKNEYLAMTLSRELDEEEKAQKGKTEPEKQEDEKKDGDDYKEPVLPVGDSLMKKYLQYFRVMTEPDEAL